MTDEEKKSDDERLSQEQLATLGDDMESKAETDPSQQAHDETETQLNER